jgi:hypothetical protein
VLGAPALRTARGAEERVTVEARLSLSTAGPAQGGAVERQ